MATKERIKQVVEIVKNHGRMQRSKLIKFVEQEGLMSHQTTSDAIDEAVKFHKLYRNVDYKGKQKIVWYSINDDIIKAEGIFKQELDKIIKKYDSKFLIFKEKYPKLNLQEKGDGIDLFSFLLREIIAIIGKISEGFDQTNYWKKLMKEIVETRPIEFQKLASKESVNDLGMLSLYVLSENYKTVDGAFEDVEEYLKELK